MLLRSSSTPVLGSLLSSISESPSHHNSEVHHATIKHSPPTSTLHHNHKKLSFHQTSSPHYTFSCNSSPSVTDFSLSSRRHSENGFRRAHSEGNLEGLANASCNPDEFCMSIPLKKFSRRSNSSMLETIPSFSFHSSRNRYGDVDSDLQEEEEEEEEEEAEEEYGGFFVNSLMEQNSMVSRGKELTLEKQNLGSDDHEVRNLDSYKGIGLGENKGRIPEMHLSRGLGVDSGNDNIGFGGGNGSGGGGEHFITGAGGESGGGGFNGPGIEEHYKRLVEENPGNPLFLRNYAQFLYQSKGDLPRAEDYYSRAILADSRDGEILSQYAKLIWELHHDQDRALSYFERAVQAAPEDSHVQAAYASFLWEAEDDQQNVPSVLPTQFYNGAMAAADATTTTPY